MGSVAAPPEVQPEAVSLPEPVWVWGVPFTPLTLPQTLDAVDRLIAARRPGYFITANLNYAMISANDPRVAPVNAAARFILADGMPPVWASRWGKRPLPERVAGSDLIYALSERAAEKGHRLFLLGAAPGVGDLAAKNLTERYPGLVVAGVEAPPFRPLTDEEEAALVDRIRDARPDILLVAFGQPRGELWIAKHCERLGVPVAAQVGASIDFAAGRVRRAPRWVQKLGVEWMFRLALEPGRLAKRYFQNACFLARAVTVGARR